MSHSVKMFYCWGTSAGSRNVLVHLMTWDCGELVRTAEDLCPHIRWQLVANKSSFFSVPVHFFTRLRAQSEEAGLQRLSKSEHGNGRFHLHWLSVFWPQYQLLWSTTMGIKVAVCGVCSCRWSPVIAELVAMRMSGKKTHEPLSIGQRCARTCSFLLSYTDLSGGGRELLVEGGRLGVEGHKMYSRHVK